MHDGSSILHNLQYSNFHSFRRSLKQLPGGHYILACSDENYNESDGYSTLKKTDHEGDLFRK